MHVVVSWNCPQTTPLPTRPGRAPPRRRAPQGRAQQGNPPVGAPAAIGAGADGAAGIQEGTLLVVDSALEPRHNDIVIAVVDGELTVKRLEKRRGKIRLIAENPAYAPIEFKAGGVGVWGVVRSIIQKLK